MPLLRMHIYADPLGWSRLTLNTLASQASANNNIECAPRERKSNAFEERLDVYARDLECWKLWSASIKMSERQPVPALTGFIESTPKGELYPRLFPSSSGSSLD
jgi:hypothetical protein